MGSERDTANVFLIGMMGAGKSTVGRALARRLEAVFVDTDRELVRRTGVAIATIFEFEGEPGFRRRESALLREVASATGQVIATGGGAILAEDNRNLMRQTGTVVYLRARLERLWDRTRHDSTRPLLATGNPRATLAEILEQREPLYLESAHFVVDTGAQSASSLAARIVTRLRDHAPKQGHSA